MGSGGAWLCLGSGTCGVWAHLALTDMRSFSQRCPQEAAELGPLPSAPPAMPEMGSQRSGSRGGRAADRWAQLEADPENARAHTRVRVAHLAQSRRSGLPGDK